MGALTTFGLLAVTAMLPFYALEERSPWYVLAFAGACAFGVGLRVPARCLAVWHDRGHLGRCCRAPLARETARFGRREGIVRTWHRGAKVGAACSFADPGQNAGPGFSTGASALIGAIRSSYDAALEELLVHATTSGKRFEQKRREILAHFFQPPARLRLGRTQRLVRTGH